MYSSKSSIKSILSVGYIKCFTFFILSNLGCSQNKNQDPPNQKAEGMVWIPGGTFTIGTNDETSYPQERPAHQVSVDGFWIDETEVTNKQFSEFVKTTGYITIAELKPDWEQLKTQVPPGTPKPPDSLLVAGSLVYTPPAGVVVSLNDYSQWWKWTAGANWQHPEGPDSNIDQRKDHPVVHIAWEDAMAYCQWAKKRLPTEAEWELAARGGEITQYIWREELSMNGKYVANTFQGSFPNKELVEDGFSRTAPVKSFPPNAIGLHDMIGNVWEWTSDWYDYNYYQTLSKNETTKNPTGPERPYDPHEPYAQKRVMKGGSFLCASNYCVNYRPTARQGTAFDSGSSNVGFRCVKDR